MTATFGSLFAGVGGFDLAFERAGFTPAFQVEIDEKASSILARHWPDTPRFTDIREVNANVAPEVNVLVGGFPCQDISVAGARAGLAGERSGLWWEYHRLLSELRPEWCVIENVAGLLSSGKPRGSDLGAILGALGELGYGFAYRVLDAQGFGVPQRRRRVFIVGRLGDGRGPVEVLFEPESGGGDLAPRREAGQEVAGTLGGGLGSVFNPYRTSLGPGEWVEGFKPDHVHDALTASPPPKGPPVVVQGLAYPVTMRGREGGANFEMGQEGVYNSLRAGDGGSSRANYVAHGTQQELAVRRLTPRECERLQGFPDDHTAGQPDSARYKQMGNAVAVPVVEWIARRMMAVVARERQAVA